MKARSARIPVPEILARAVHPPWRDRAFWAVQVMVVIWAIAHVEADLHSFETGIVPTVAPIDLLLVPVGYAALRYGLSGAGATALWATLLWLPDLLLPGHRGHTGEDLVQLGIVVIVAFFIGVEIERAHLERAAAEAAEAERRAAEVHYHQLFDTNASPILLVDRDGAVVEANRAAVALWRVEIGAGAEQLLGVRNEDLLEGRSPQTVQLKTAHGEERDYRLAVSQLVTAGRDALRQVVLEDVTEEYRSGSEARAWASEVLRAQEEERRRIAREIHDDPLQRLLQLARRMEALVSPACSAQEVERLGAVRTELLDVVAHLRDVTRMLRPAGLEQFGLVAAVRGLLADVEVEEDLATDLVVTGDVARGAPEGEVGVFRIVQEAVRNVVRHADASRLLVEISYDTDTVCATVRDNGRGFAYTPTGPLTDGHLGILGMRERARLLDGRCEVLSSAGGGTVVTATVPLRRARRRCPGPGREHG